LSESELIELLVLSQSETAQNVMNLTAIVFAYVLTAYFVGAQLSRGWAIGVSFCYTLFIVPIFVGCSMGVQLTSALSTSYVADFPNGSALDIYLVYVEAPVLSQILILAPIGVGWLGSLFYLHLYVRADRSTE